MQEQLTFDFPYVQNFSMKDYIQDSCNIDALRWIMSWPHWPNKKLIIFSRGHSGKSYIGNLWLKSVYGYEIKVDDFKTSVRDIFIKNDNFLIDNIESILNHKLAEVHDNKIEYCDMQKWLFDFLNIAQEKKVTILILAKSINFRWIKLNDLASRLSAINSVKILDPDIEFIKKVFLKMAADQGLYMKDEVVNYILLHSERDLDFLEKLLLSLNKVSLSEKKNITIPLVKQVIA